jgi:hypothetical protein
MVTVYETPTEGGCMLYAKGRTIRPDVPCRVLGIDPGGGWTGFCIADPGFQVPEAFTISRYAVDGYDPERDFHARNCKHWTRLRNSGKALSHLYDGLYLDRVIDKIAWAVQTYKPAAVVLEGMDPSVIHMAHSPFKAETARQTTLVYGGVRAVVRGAIVVPSGGDRGKWGQPAHGGAGQEHHYPPELCGRAKRSFHPSDTVAVKARFGWKMESLEHPRESYDHITAAVQMDLLPRRAA